MLTITENPTIKAIVGDAEDAIKKACGKEVIIVVLAAPVFDFPVDDKEKRIIRHVRNAVSEGCGVDWATVVSKSRKREIVIARHLYCFHLKSLTKLSLKSIGKSVGDRDHTTVINSINNVKDLLHTGELLMTEKFKAVQSKLILNETEAQS